MDEVRDALMDDGSIKISEQTKKYGERNTGIVKAGIENLTKSSNEQLIELCMQELGCSREEALAVIEEANIASPENLITNNQENIQSNNEHEIDD